MKLARDLSIGQRLFAAFALVVVVLVATAATLSSFRQDGGRAQSQFVEAILPASQRAVDLERQLAQLSVAVRAQLLAPELARSRQVALGIEHARRTMTALRTAYRDGEGLLPLAPVEAALEGYLEQATATAAIADTAAADALEAPLSQTRARALEHIHGLMAQQRERARKAIAAMEVSRERVGQGLLAAYAVVAVVLAMLGWLIASSIRAPARHLTEVAARVGDGQWQEALALGPKAAAARGEPLKPRDELARIGLAFGAAAEALERRELRLRVDAAVSQAACSGHNAHAMAETALRVLGDATGAAVGVIYGVDPESSRLVPLASRALAEAPHPIALGEGLPGRAAVERKPLVEQAFADRALRINLGVHDAAPRTVAAIPVMLADEVLAVLVLGSLQVFDESRMELLSSGVVQLALGLNNARAHAQLQLNNEEIQAQAEELQAQSEELQAQSEELQAQNDELQQRSGDLAEADRNKNHFLGLLAHELRNPLGAISNSLYVLQRSTGLDERGARSLSVIQRQMSYVRHLIDDLLDITRVSHGKLRLKREPVDLVELLRECVQDARASAARLGLAIEADIAPGPVHALVDRTRIAQVVGNLLGNALKFCEPGGQVRVRFARSADGENASIAVLDNGIGIDPELQRRLFQPFSQGESGSERAQAGLGLGLALSKALVELHEGRIAVHSEGPGRGTEFTVTLPLSRPPLRPNAAPEAVLAPPGRRRILVIEDNSDAAETMRMALELEGHVVDVAGDGITGVDKARASRPDVVLCDLGIPGIDGYEVARKLRASSETSPVTLIALSGYAMEEDRARSSVAGFDAHLAKPVEMRTLGSLIAQFSQSSDAPANV